MGQCAENEHRTNGYASSYSSSSKKRGSRKSSNPKADDAKDAKTCFENLVNVSSWARSAAMTNRVSGGAVLIFLVRRQAPRTYSSQSGMMNQTRDCRLNLATCMSR